MYYQFKSQFLIAPLDVQHSFIAFSPSLTTYPHSHRPRLWPHPATHLTLSATSPYLSLHITINCTPTTSSNHHFVKSPSSIFRLIINCQTKSLHYCTPLHHEFLSRSRSNVPSSSFIRRLICHSPLRRIVSVCFPICPLILLSMLSNISYT